MQGTKQQEDQGQNNSFTRILIAWLSKKQPTVETSVFGADFVVLKSGPEKLRGIRYKLRMMGVPIFGPSFVFGENMSVIHNTQRPESMIKKKSNQIYYRSQWQWEKHLLDMWIPTRTHNAKDTADDLTETNDNHEICFQAAIK